MFEKRLSVIVACGTFCIGGCATVSNDNYDKYTDKFSAHQLIDREDFEPIDLVSLIGEPSSNGKTPSTITAGSTNATTSGKDIDAAFRAFAEANRNSGDVGRARRNEIQERMLAASDQRCNDFKTLLQKKFANANFVSGVVSTAASVAASIVRSVEGSKTLAGVAGLTNGYRSEYNQAFFANAAAQVVVAGIDSRRRTAYEQMLRVRKESLADFPLEAAVKDAIRYHGLCSTVSGLQEAGEAVRYYNEPGIAAATRTIARAKMLADLQSTPADQTLQKLAEWQNSIPAERYLAGNPLGASVTTNYGDGQSLIDHYMATLASLRKRGSELDSVTKDVSTTIVPPADRLKSLTIVTGIANVLDAGCKPAYQKISQRLLDLQGQQNASKDANEVAELASKLAQTKHDVSKVKAGVDFVSANYISRAAGVQTAVKALGSTPDAAKIATVTTALASLNRLAPKISGDCDVSVLE